MTQVGPVNPYGQYPYGYGNYPQATPVSSPYGGYPTGGDMYMPGAYGQGYVQGATASSGLSSGITASANAIGGIFNTVTSVVATVLNTIVNFIVNIFKGIFDLVKNLFGIEDKSNNQQVVMQPPMGYAPPMQGGAMQPQLPPPPPGTDINQAFQIVQGDLAHIMNPNQGIQIVNLHSQKAKDNRNAAEQAAKEAEQAAAEAAKIAENLHKRLGRISPYELQKMLNDIEINKTKALERLKMAEELTKAVYDEALYTQLANDILFGPGGRFPQYGQATVQSVANAWKAWTQGYDEKKWLFFNNHLEPAPVVFMKSAQSVNMSLNKVNYILTNIR